MKEFSDFMATLTEEKVCRIMNDVNSAKIEFTLPLNGDTMPKFINGVGSVDYLICLGLLREYHEWLNK